MLHLNGALGPLQGLAVTATDLKLGQKDLDPVSARLFVELLSGNRVVQVLADLDAVEEAVQPAK